MLEPKDAAIHWLTGIGDPKTACGLAVSAREPPNTGCACRRAARRTEERRARSPQGVRTGRRVFRRAAGTRAPSLYSAERLPDLRASRFGRAGSRRLPACGPARACGVVRLHPRSAAPDFPPSRPPSWSGGCMTRSPMPDSRPPRLRGSVGGPRPRSPPCPPPSTQHRRSSLIPFPGRFLRPLRQAALHRARVPGRRPFGLPLEHLGKQVQSARCCRLPAGTPGPHTGRRAPPSPARAGPCRAASGARPSRFPKFLRIFVAEG